MLPANRKIISAAYTSMNAAARRFTQKTKIAISLPPSFPLPQCDLVPMLCRFITAPNRAAAFFFPMKLATLAAEIADMLAKSLLYSLMVTTPHSQYIEYSFTSGAL